MRLFVMYSAYALNICVHIHMYEDCAKWSNYLQFQYVVNIIIYTTLSSTVFGLGYFNRYNSKSIKIGKMN